MEHHSNLVPWQLLGAGGRRAGLRPGRRRGPARPRRARRRARAPAEARRGRARLQRARHDQPDRRDHRAARTPPARSSWSTARRRRRTCRSTSPRSAPTSTPGPATRPTGRPGIGVLHGRRELLEAMPPFLGGGHMIARVGDDELHVRRAARASSRRARCRSPRRSGSAPPSTTCPGIGMDAVWEHSRDVVGYAVERLQRAPGSRSTARRTSSSAAALCSFAHRRRAPARRGRDPRPRGRLRPRRPPLRAAADAPPRRARPRSAPRSPCTPRARTSTAWSTALGPCAEVFA